MRIISTLLSLNIAVSFLQGSATLTTNVVPCLQDLDFMFLPAPFTISMPPKHHSSPRSHFTALSMSEESNQPSPATRTAGLEAGFKALNIECKTPDTKNNIAFLARAMAHIGSPSFVPPVPIEGPESVLPRVNPLSKDTPLIIRVATEKEYNSADPPSQELSVSPTLQIIGYLMRRHKGLDSLSTIGLASGFNESVVTRLRDNLGNAQAEGMSSWIKAPESRIQSYIGTKNFLMSGGPGVRRRVSVRVSRPDNFQLRRIKG